MAKTITLNYDGQPYTLEFTRKTVEQMEGLGFKIRELRDKPITMLPELFAGAFQARHKWVKPKVIDEIYNATPNKDELMLALIEMYSEPIETMFDEPQETEKNVNWEASF